MKISLAGWSLHRRFRSQENPLLLLDFPRVARQEFGLNAIELNSPFFVSRDKRYLTELDDVAVGEGVDLLNIAVDGMGDLSDPDRAARQRAVENNAVWLAVAAHLGCAQVRINTGGKGRENDPDALLHCMDGYVELAQRGSKEGVMVLIENHGGLSANPDNIVKIIETVDSPWIGTLPDFGNFPPEIDRYEALEKLMPYAAAVHAKMGEFDEQGLETRFDIPRCYQIVKKGGYDGYLGIEFEGPGDEYEGVQQAKALLEKCISEQIKYEGSGKSMAAVKTFGKKIPGLTKKLGISRGDGDRGSGS
jgi:sugar phosphate isomerase/epimerase